MTAGSLSIKLKSTSLELANDFTMTKAREAAHLCGHYDRVVVTIPSHGKRDFTLPFPACFNELRATSANGEFHFQNNCINAAVERRMVVSELNRFSTATQFVSLRTVR